MSDIPRLVPPDDPFVVLGLGPRASAEEIRAAYLRLLKDHPPDRDPAAFERIRDAYQAIAEPAGRAREILRANPRQSFVSLLAKGSSASLRHVGPAAWLRVLRER